MAKRAEKENTFRNRTVRISEVEVFAMRSRIESNATEEMNRITSYRCTSSQSDYSYSSWSSRKLETKRWSETALLINVGNVNRELQMTFLSSFFFRMKSCFRYVGWVPQLQTMYGTEKMARSGHKFSQHNDWRKLPRSQLIDWPIKAKRPDEIIIDARKWQSPAHEAMFQ